MTINKNQHKILLVVFLILSSLFSLFSVKTIASSISNQAQIQFTNLNNVETLSHPAVNTITQDKMGFIWLGNQNGLNRFDGIASKIYTHIPGDPTSLSSNWVNKVFVDSEERLWVLGNAGFSLYLPEIDAFKNFINAEQYQDVLGKNYKAIAEDSNGSIWFGSKDKGAVVLDVKSSTFKSIEQLNNDSILDLTFDHNNNLWVATENNGIKVRLSGQEDFNSFTTKSNISIPTNKIQTVFEDKLNNIWIGTENAGAFQFNLNEGVSRAFLYSEDKLDSLCSNYVFDIYQDTNQVIWFATDGGLCQFDPMLDTFIRHKHNNARVSSLIDNRVTSLFQDSGGVMWVGTFAGVSRWNAVLKPFTHVSKNFGIGKELSSNVVAALSEDSKGNVYVGTWGGGS